jgi:hypothetical protein
MSDLTKLIRLAEANPEQAIELAETLGVTEGFFRALEGSRSHNGRGVYLGWWIVRFQVDLIWRLVKLEGLSQAKPWARDTRDPEFVHTVIHYHDGMLHPEHRVKLASRAFTLARGAWLRFRPDHPKFAFFTPSMHRTAGQIWSECRLVDAGIDDLPLFGGER